MDNSLRMNIVTVATVISVACFLHANSIAADADNGKCTYNSLITNFNRKAHENGHGFYYECDEQTGYYIEKMCDSDETFDEKKLSCVKEYENVDLLQSARLTQSQSKLCRGKEDGTRIANYAEKCQSFFICKGGVPEETACSTGFLFNPKTKNCDWPANVECVCKGKDCKPSGKDSNENTDGTTHQGPTAPWPSTITATSTTDCGPGHPTVPTTPAWDDICVDGTPEDTPPPCPSTTGRPPTSTAPTPPTPPSTTCGPTTSTWSSTTSTWSSTTYRPTTSTWSSTTYRPTTSTWSSTTTYRPTSTTWPSHCPSTTQCPCTCPSTTTECSTWPSTTESSTTINHWPSGLPSVTWRPPTNDPCPPWGCVSTTVTMTSSIGTTTEPPLPTPSTPATSTFIPSTPSGGCPPGGCMDGIPEPGPPLPTPSTPRPPNAGEWWENPENHHLF